MKEKLKIDLFFYQTQQTHKTTYTQNGQTLL